MKPHGIIQIKADKRFKLGHIVRQGEVLRGHPDTVKLERLGQGINPPIVITNELGKAMEESGLL